MPHSEYPAPWRNATTAVSLFVLLLNLAEYLLAWLRSLYALLYSPLNLPPIPFFDPDLNAFQTLLIAHIGLLAALIASRAVAFLTPRISIRPNGLYFDSPLGSRFVPRSALRGVRSVELQNARFVVWVDSTRGLPLQNLIASLLFGRWFWRGFLLTSDVSGFDGIVADIVDHLKSKYDAEAFAAHYSDEPTTWLLEMLNAPRTTVRDAAVAETLPIAERQAQWHVASFVGCLLLPTLLAAIIHLQIPWGAFIAVLLAAAEWPLVSLYLTVVPLESIQRFDFGDALRIYPLTQLPRWIVAIGLALLVAAGAPLPFFLVAVIPAVILGCIPVLSLTEAWFDVRFPESLIGILVTAIVQVLTYELLVVMLPR